MAKTKTLGSAIVRFISQGVGKLKAEIGAVQGATASLATMSERQQRRMAREAIAAGRAAASAKRWWDDLGSSFTRVGAYALTTLGIATAAAGGFLRLADPRGMDMLTIAFGRLGIQIGRMFVPAVRAVTEWVNKATDFMKGLTDATRETIFSWMKWGAIGLASVGTFAILSGVVLRIVGHLRVLRYNLGWVGTKLASIGVMPWVAGVLAAIAVVGALAGSFDGIQQRAAALWESLQTLFSALVTALQPFIDAIGSLATSLLPLVVSAVTILVDSLTFLVTVLSSVVNWLGASGIAGIAAAAAILMLPAIIARAVAGFWSLVGSAQAAITSIRALGASMLAFVSSPWGLAFMAIAAVVGGLVAAFSGAAAGVDRFGDRMLRLDEISRRLRSGGTLSREDLSRSLPAAEVERLMRMDPTARRAEARRLSEEAGRELGGMPGADALSADEARIRGVLEASRTVAAPLISGDISTEGGAGVAGWRGRERVRRLREAAGVSEDAITSLGGARGLATGGGFLGMGGDPGLDVDTLLRERGPTARRRELESRRDTLGAIADGRVEGSDRYRGEARPQKAEFVGILDLARRIQTASTEDPATAIARETRDEARLGRELLAHVEVHTRALPRMRGIVPGRT